VVGIWGTDVQLADGRSVTVDDAYVRRSITEPGADVVEGYNPIMPTLPLTDDEVDRLVDWVRSLE
jgi:cytochrome c oxidase subunit 2